MSFEMELISNFLKGTNKIDNSAAITLPPLKKNKQTTVTPPKDVNVLLSANISEHTKPEEVKILN